MSIDVASPVIASALAAIQQALTSGGDLLTALLPASEQRGLRAAALARRFDRAMFDELMAPAADATPEMLERLLDVGAVQPTPGRSGWYALDDKRRAHWLDLGVAAGSDSDDLTVGAPKWTQLHQQLADAFAARGPDAEIERLYHRLILRQSQAEAHWRELYASACECFDLARCESLLDLLGQTARFISPELASVMTRERGLLGARAALADDYFRTGRYLERRQVLADFESLLTDPQRFILQMHAPGGSGKTLFLCWLGARWCLPRGMPIARVDFDFLDDAERALAPVFLLGKLAERLDTQLPGAPLFELLRDIAEERRRCLAPEGGEGVQARLAALEAEVRERLARTLVERCAGTSVVLVLDTLEEATLKHQVNVLDVVEAISAVRRRVQELAPAPHAPKLLLILAGRYTLAEQYPLVQARFASQVLACEVTPFDDAESRGYLQRRLTGIEPPSDAVLAAVVQRAHGSPFKLSLYADILLTTPDLDVAGLGRGVDVDMLYLIERVLKRITDARLRWLLRYGVLARRLTRSFVDHVLLRAMRSAWRGDLRSDDPAQDGVAHKDWPALWAGPSGAAQRKLDTDVLWRQLREYASASSWVSVDAQVSEAVVIQPVVSHPMRRALLQRDRPVVEQVHRAAMAYARSSAATRSDAERLAELSYHDFQLHGAAAAPAWLRRVQQWQLDDEVVEALALLVLSRDLADSEATPGAPALVPPWARAHALFALAEMHAQRGRISEDSSQAVKHLMQARQQLAQFDAIALPGNAPQPGLAQRGQLRLALAADADQKRAALRELEDALRQRPEAELRSQVLLALERGYRTLDAPRAREFGRQWGRLVWRQGDAESYAESVQAEVDQCLREAAPRQALRLSLQAQDDLSPAQPRWRSRSAAGAAKRSLAQGMPQLLEAAGLSDAALRLQLQQMAVRGAEPGSSARRLQHVEHAELVLAAGDAGSARALASAALHAGPEPSSAHHKPATSALKLRALRVLAQAARSLLDHGAALDAMSQAMSMQAELGEHFDEVRTRLSMARVYLFDLGNLRLAAEHLQDNEDALSGEDIELRAEHLLMRSALHDRMGQEASSQQLLAQARGLLAQVPSERWRVRMQLAVGGLALNDAATRIEQAQALADTLEGVDYVGLRLQSMRELRHVRPLVALPASLVRHLDRLCQVQPLKLPSQQRLLPGDRIRLVMQRAEMLRVLTLPERAVQELRGLRALVAAQEPQPWQRQLALCCDRLGLAPTEVLPANWLTRLLITQKRWRGFCAVVRAEAADRAARAGEAEAAAKLLKHALRELDQPGMLPASWQALALASQLALASRQPKLFADLDVKANVQRARHIGETLGMPGALMPASAPVAPQVVAAGLATAKATGAAAAVGAESLEPAAAMGLRIFDADSVTRVAYLHSGQMHERRNTPLQAPICAMLAEFGAGRFSEAASWELVSRLGAMGFGFGRELAACALPEMVQERLRHVYSSGLPPLELLIEHRQPGMHAMPWELMLPTLLPMQSPVRALTLHGAVQRVWRAPALSGLQPRIAWVQTALGLLGQGKLVVDGQLGAATAQALRAWQQSAGVEVSGVADDASVAALQTQLTAKRSVPSASPPRSGAVLLIKPMHAAEQRTQRGLSTGGADLEYLYRGEGAQLEVLDQPDLERLRGLLARQAWTAIHIATPIAQSRSSRELSLQFAADAHSAHTTVLGASVVARLMEGLPTKFAPPLLVIESPRPTSRDETIRQLLQRNAFAAHVFEYGKLPAVVAMGLAPPQMQHRYSSTLVQNLFEGLTPAELVQRLRQADPERGAAGSERDLVELLPSAGIALFARDALTMPLMTEMS